MPCREPQHKPQQTTSKRRKTNPTNRETNAREALLPVVDVVRKLRPGGKKTQIFVRGTLGEQLVARCVLCVLCVLCCVLLLLLQCEYGRAFETPGAAKDACAVSGRRDKAEPVGVLAVGRVDPCSMSQSPGPVTLCQRHLFAGRVWLVPGPDRALPPQERRGRLCPGRLPLPPLPPLHPLAVGQPHCRRPGIPRQSPRSPPKPLKARQRRRHPR